MAAFFTYFSGLQNKFKPIELKAYPCMNFLSCPLKAGIIPIARAPFLAQIYLPLSFSEICLYVGL